MIAASVLKGLKGTSLGSLVKIILIEDRFSHVPDFYQYLYKSRVHCILFLKIALNSQRRLVTLEPSPVDFLSINTLSKLPIVKRRKSLDIAVLY